MHDLTALFLGTKSKTLFDDITREFLAGEGYEIYLYDVKDAFTVSRATAFDNVLDNVVAVLISDEC